MNSKTPLSLAKANTSFSGERYEKSGKLWIFATWITANEYKSSMPITGKDNFMKTGSIN